MDTTVKNGPREGRMAVLISVLLGLWVIISPFVLGVPAMTGAMWTNVIIGAAVIVVALIGLVTDGAVLGAIIPLATWLFASTFVLEWYEPHFLWSNIIAVFVLIAEAAYSGSLREMPASHGG